MTIKYDTVLGSLRESDESSALTIGDNHFFSNNTERDTYFSTHKKELIKLKTLIFVGGAFQLWSGENNPAIYSSSNWRNVTAIVRGSKGEKGDPGDTDALIKEYGTDGRVRFDNASKHWFFESLNNGVWIKKVEIGESILVDKVILIKGDKPTNIDPEDIAFYNKEIILSDGSRTVRPHFVLPNGSEYSFVVCDESNGNIVYRDPSTEKLIHIPISYVDKEGNEYSDLSKIKFTGGVDVTKIGDELNVDIISQHLGYSFINIVNDLAIMESNLVTYNSHTISMREDGSAIQFLDLPEISSINGIFSIKIRNDRPNSKSQVNIRPTYPDTIGGSYFMSLQNGDSVYISNPDSGTEWIIESLVRKSDINNIMDGGEL